MEEVYYLVHVTNNPDCINWSELRCSNFNTNNQFPGVYLSLITKYNIKKDLLYPGKYLIILSRKLLLQQNYHINLTDHNGIISEKNTYFPWNLDKCIRKYKRFLLKNKYTITHNEVIFHDNIDMKYCCGIIGILKNDIYVYRNEFLPTIKIENKEDPDMTKLPFYCYPFEYMYDGVPLPVPKSSNKWYEMMSNVCNVNIDEANNNHEEIIKKIKDKAYELYNNRHEQNISLLKDYSQSTIKKK